MFIKLSLLILYLRLLNPARHARILIYVGFFIIIIFYPFCPIFALVLCIPYSKQGYMALKTEKYGIPTVALASAQGVVGIVTDFYVLAIPLYMIQQTQMSPRRKLGIAGIFLTGLL